MVRYGGSQTSWYKKADDQPELSLLEPPLKQNSRADLVRVSGKVVLLCRHFGIVDLLSAFVG